MTLDDRLSEARQHYQRLAPPESAPQQGRSRRAAAMLVGVAAVAVVVAGVVWWPSDSEPGSHPVDVGSTPSTTAPGDEAGVIGEITLDPTGPYVDGQEVTATVPGFFSRDRANERPLRLCSAVAPREVETCDPLFEQSVEWSEADGVEWSSFAIPRTTFTPLGYQDCAAAEVRCRLIWAGTDGARVSTTLDFTGERTERPAMDVRPGEAGGSLVVDLSGLGPAAKRLDVCEFGPAEPQRNPWGEAAWVSVEPPSLDALAQFNCEGYGSSTPERTIDPSGVVEVTVPPEFPGQHGWSSCADGGCFLLAHGEDYFAPRVAAYAVGPISTDPSPRPALTIAEPPPYRIGQQITVELSGVPDFYETTVGLCHRDRPGLCGYDGRNSIQGNTTTTYRIRDRAADCAPDNCYLEIDSGGEGLAPLATVALPIGEGDPTDLVGAITIDPPGPYRDGQRVIASVPEDFILDPGNPTPPRLCAEVEGIETCDPHDLSLHPGLAGGAERAVFLNQLTFTWNGYQDCADPEVSCRLLWEGDGGVRATMLEFVGAPSDDRPTLEVRPVGRPGQFAVTPSGLEEYPVMWPPGGFEVTLCAFAPAAAPLDPQGEAIWAFAPPPSVPAVDPPNCDTGVLGVGPILLDSSDGPTTVELPSQFLGYWGWSDCRTDFCFLLLAGANATSLAAAPVVFTENEPRTPRPSITIVDDPPYAVGQEITVEITDLSDDVDTMIGVCSRFQPWVCGYSFETAGSGAYTTTYEIPDIVNGCAPDDCYLELDSSGEGVPPLATVALPIDSG